jgi:hypothetical protein
MKSLLIVATICLIAAPVFASPGVMPVQKIKGYTTIGYNPATAQTYPGSQISPRWGRVMYWTIPRAYFGGMYDTTPGASSFFNVLDWGDLGTPGTGFSIGGCYILVLGNQAVPTPGGQLQVTWIAEENGVNTVTRIPWARLNLINLPGFPYSPPGWGSGWNFAIDFQTMGWQWTLDGNDIDVDGLVDFGYSYWFVSMPAGTTNAGITFGPYFLGTGTGGAEDIMDLFGDPNYVTYYGTYWFGGPPYFAQFRQQTYAWTCPNAGTTPPGVLDYCWTDIYPPGSAADCVINISDLGTLLPNYNQPGTYTYFQGDVYPKYFGDGVVDISDLGQMLGQYLDNCN